MLCLLTMFGLTGNVLLNGVKLIPQAQLICEVIHLLMLNFAVPFPQNRIFVNWILVVN
jgi:hypothetical protein